MGGFEREIILIPSVEDAVALHVWFYRPKLSPPYPVVIAGPGMAVVKEAGLATFGEQWAERAGCASLIFDYRGFGDTGGEPRNLVDLTMQLDDYKSVLKYARQRPDVFQNDKIVVMGGGSSGLFVLQLALEDPGLAGGMAHSPMLDGYEALMSAGFRPRLMFWAILDAFKSMLGWSPIFIKAVGKPNEFALLNFPSVYSGFVAMFKQGATPFSQAPNLIAPRIIFQLMAARPATRLQDVLCPLLIVAARHDDIIPISIARRIAEDSKNTMVTSVEVNGGHFDVMNGGKCFDININAQIDFLQKIVDQNKG